ncbi:MAG TPA: TlpA disulfide reductase family protein [Xanthobacteraceae bacterium]|nr:TlpA disulfide reductase family protein [Xanthobacteraceae bacterium]
MKAIDRRRLFKVLANLSLLPTAPMAASGDALPLVELPGNVDAPDFLLPDLAGNVHRFYDYRGRPVLVSFWAAWCAPCRRELPSLADLSARLKDAEIKVLAVNLGDSAERISAFLTDHPSPGLPILLGGRGTGKAWHVGALPVAYGVDPEGILRLGALGEQDWDSPLVEHQLRGLSRTGPRRPSTVQPA